MTLELFTARLETKCSNPKCGKEIFPGEETYVDFLATASYCGPCGVCLRFHRKKAEQRGEAIPITFANAEK